MRFLEQHSSDIDQHWPLPPRSALSALLPRKKGEQLSSTFFCFLFLFFTISDFFLLGGGARRKVQCKILIHCLYNIPLFYVLRSLWKK